MTGIKETAAIEELAAHEARDQEVQDAPWDENISSHDEENDEDGIIEDLLFMIGDLQHRLSDVEQRIQSYNERASHKI